MSVHNFILGCIKYERCGLPTWIYMGLALRLWFVHLVQCKGPRMNQITSKWIRCWFTLARTVCTAMIDQIIITSHKGSYCLMYLNADLISGTGAPKSVCTGYGVIKARNKFLLRICNTLVHPYLTTRERSRVHVCFPCSVQITRSWSLGHSCLFLAIVHFVFISFSMWFPRALVWCESHGLESLSKLSRYWLVNNQMHWCYHNRTYSGDALSASNITEVKTSPHSAFLFRPPDAIVSIQTARCMYHIECQVDKLTWPWYGNSDSSVL